MSEPALRVELPVRSSTSPAGTIWRANNPGREHLRAEVVGVTPGAAADAWTIEVAVYAADIDEALEFWWAVFEDMGGDPAGVYPVAKDFGIEGPGVVSEAVNAAFHIAHLDEDDEPAQ